MRPNLVLMLSFLIFLIGFFSSQVALTGQTVRSDYFTSLSNEELDRYGDLTVDYCRVLARDVAYAQRSRGLERVPLETGQGEPRTKTQYQLQARGDDLNGDRRLDYRDTELCYALVNEGGVYARASLNLRPDRMNSCVELGEKTCIDDTPHTCLPDQKGDLSWVPVGEHAGKAQECLFGTIVSLVVPKPWLDRKPWLDSLS